ECGGLRRFGCFSFQRKEKRSKAAGTAALQTGKRAGAASAGSRPSPLLAWAGPQAILGRLDDLDHHAGNVIARAGLQGKAAQPVGAILHVGLVLDEAQELLISHYAAEAIGTQQEAVACL